MDAPQHPKSPADVEARACPLPLGPARDHEGPGVARLALMVGTVFERLTTVDDSRRTLDARSR